MCSSGRASGIFASAMSLVLVACGGGGGGGAPAPTVSASVSASKVSVGENVRISWTSTNATSCSIPELGAPESIPGNTFKDYVPTSGGVKMLTVTCTGAGRTASAEVKLTVPMPVYATSYENLQEPTIDDPTTPYLAAIGVKLNNGDYDVNRRAIAFADFLQNGSYDTVMVVTAIYKGVDTDGSNPGKISDSPGKIYFIQRDATGKWTDVSARLMPDEKSRYVCISTGFSVVADFNKDKKPDIFIGCSGKDYEIRSDPDDLRNEGSDLQYVLLSQPDGTYKANAIPDSRIYSHKVVAFDVNGDGNVDVVSSDASRCKSPTGPGCKPLVFWGRGDGTFFMDYTVFPNEMRQTAIFNVSHFIANGENYIVVAGQTPRSYQYWTDSSRDFGTQVMQFRGGKFQIIKNWVPTTPIAPSGRPYNLSFDTIYRDGHVFTAYVDESYQNEVYVKINLLTGEQVKLLEKKSTGGNHTAGLLKITSTNHLVNVISGCNKAAPPSDLDPCQVKIKLN